MKNPYTFSIENIHSPSIVHPEDMQEWKDLIEFALLKGHTAIELIQIINDLDSEQLIPANNANLYCDHHLE